MSEAATNARKKKKKKRTIIEAGMNELMIQNEERKEGANERMA